jgi:hypothetical protein
MCMRVGSLTCSARPAVHRPGCGVAASQANRLIDKLLSE